MKGHYHWEGLVLPYHRRARDNRVFTHETRFMHRKLNFPIVWNDPRPSRRWQGSVLGFCNRVIVDSAVGVSVGLWLDLAELPYPGVFWAQADLSPEFVIDNRPSENTFFFKKAELIGFHLGTQPAWRWMAPIVITEEMLEEEEARHEHG